RRCGMPAGRCRAAAGRIPARGYLRVRRRSRAGRALVAGRGSPAIRGGTAHGDPISPRPGLTANPPRRMARWVPRALVLALAVFAYRPLAIRTLVPPTANEFAIWLFRPSQLPVPRCVGGWA